MGYMGIHRKTETARKEKRVGILESIQIGLALDGSFTNETFKRI